jgi:hypothetical protein
VSAPSSRDHGGADTCWETEGCVHRRPSVHRAVSQPVPQITVPARARTPAGPAESTAIYARVSTADRRPTTQLDELRPPTGAGLSGAQVTLDQQCHEVYATACP